MSRLRETVTSWDPLMLAAAPVGASGKDAGTGLGVDGAGGPNGYDTPLVRRRYGVTEGKKGRSSPAVNEGMIRERPACRDRV